jgi:hypothetical protein
MATHKNQPPVCVTVNFDATLGETISVALDSPGLIAPLLRLS